jgi:phosphoglycolate phosphatase
MTKPILVFDMDGTLLDTREDIAAAANEVRAQLNLPVLSTADLVRFVGDGMTAFLSRAIVPESDPRFGNVTSAFEASYKANAVNKTVAYDGIPELLAELTGRGYQLAVVSNKPEQFVVQLLRHFGWEKYFTCALGGDSVPNRKPSADPIFEVCRRLGQNSVVMIGDGVQDLQAAAAAGCRAIWVSWGFTQKTPADGVATANHPREISETLTKLEL